jgi:hypothetical protein
MGIGFILPPQGYDCSKVSCSMLAEIMPGLVLPLLIASAVMAFGRFYRPLRYVTQSMKRWLSWCSILGLIVPVLILLTYPPSTDAALNAHSTRLLWPSGIMLLAADPYASRSAVAFVIGISVGANIFVYSGIGLLVWGVASLTRHWQHQSSK